MKRYNILDWEHEGEIEESPDGEWVKADDALDEIERLRSALRLFADEHNWTEKTRPDGRIIAWYHADDMPWRTAADALDETA